MSFFGKFSIGKRFLDINLLLCCLLFLLSFRISFAHSGEQNRNISSKKSYPSIEEVLNPSVSYDLSFSKDEIRSAVDDVVQGLISYDNPGMLLEIWGKKNFVQ